MRLNAYLCYEKKLIIQSNIKMSLSLSLNKFNWVIYMAD